MAGNWTLMASHGCVLFYLAANRDSTIREAAAALDLTERRVSQIVRDLSDADLLHVRKLGRRNSYEVNGDAHFPGPLSSVPLSNFVNIIQECRQTTASGF